MEQEPLLSLSISGSKKGKKWAKSGPKEGGGGSCNYLHCTCFPTLLRLNFKKNPLTKKFDKMDFFDHLAGRYLHQRYQRSC